MLRRFLLTSGLILGGAIAYSPKVVAQDVNVPFRANIDTACQVQNIEPGTLAQDYATPGVLSSQAAGSSGDPDSYGRVGLSCNTPAELTITGVTAVSTPEPDPEGTQFYVNASSESGPGSTFFDSTSGSDSPLELYGGGDNDVSVELTVDRGFDGGSFSAGMYEYEVNMTVTPK